MKPTKIISVLSRAYPNLPIDKVTTSPFRTLIVTVISQRTRDEQTIVVSQHLFSVADSPGEICELDRRKLEEILKPSGMFRQNAKRLKEICAILIDRFEGKVPTTEEELLSLPGVGRKTANIVLSQAYGKDAIAVDIHVHRITNRLGWFSTKTPFETEMALQKLIPKRFWYVVNRIFVRHGQTICTPQSPRCSGCIVSRYCKRVGIVRAR